MVVSEDDFEHSDKDNPLKDPQSRFLGKSFNTTLRYVAVSGLDDWSPDRKSIVRV